MKKIFFAIIMWACLSGVGIAGPSYNIATGVLTLPTLEVNGQIVVTNLKALVKADGTFSILGYNAPPVLIPTANKTFPYRDTIMISGLYSGDIFFLSDGSKWLVRGAPRVLFMGGAPSARDIVIYNKGSGALSFPYYGTKSEYWMLIGNIGSPYFVEPLD